MKYLSVKEQTDLLNSVMKHDGMDRSKEGRFNAFKLAAEKFGLKIKRWKKDTYFEEVSLNTNYTNCDEVQDFISKLGVSVNIVCGKVMFQPNK
jgi:hypothetical protein